MYEFIQTETGWVVYWGPQPTTLLSSGNCRGSVEEPIAPVETQQEFRPNQGAVRKSNPAKKGILSRILAFLFSMACLLFLMSPVHGQSLTPQTDLAKKILSGAWTAVTGVVDGEKMESAHPSWAMTKGLLGKHIHSEEVAAYWLAMGADPIVRKGEKGFTLLWPAKGVFLNFDNDVVSFISLNSEGNSMGPSNGRWLYAEQYRGELPANLSFGDNRAGLERKLGKADFESSNRNFFTYRHHNIGVFFDGDRIITISLFPPASPSRSRQSGQ